MGAFEQWAAGQGCALVALATRRAAPFYRAVGYEESAAYFRKVLAGQPGRKAPARGQGGAGPRGRRRAPALLRARPQRTRTPRTTTAAGRASTPGSSRGSSS